MIISFRFYHYFSQPMPSWISWYVHHYFPMYLHQFTTYIHFIIEIIIPFGLFFHNTRFFCKLFLFIYLYYFMIACSLLILLQLAILITGNYGIFNWATISLCIFGIDDSKYPIFIQEFFLHNKGIVFYPQLKSFFIFLCFSYAMFVLIFSIPPICQISKGIICIPLWFLNLSFYVQIYSIVNYYGLFGKMTTNRLEIIIEGKQIGNKMTIYD